MSKTITKNKTTLFNCNYCTDNGYYSIACNSVHNIIYCKYCNLGRTLALNHNSKDNDRRIC